MNKSSSIILVIVFILTSSCINTEGKIEIKGKTMDEATKKVIPNRKVIVEAILNDDSDVQKINAGQFYTDSSGSFSYTLNKIKNAYFYNFQFVGDSVYAFSTKEMGVYEIETNSKFLFFYLNKLTKLTIKVTSSSKSLPSTILYLNWKSDGIDGKTLYPFTISNFGSAPEYNFKWTSKDVNSKIETFVLADKPTIINWEIWNGKKKQEIIDTIICKRDITNNVNFNY